MKARAKGAIEALENIKESLCRRELTPHGREYVDKLINEYRNDISRIENGA